MGERVPLFYLDRNSSTILRGIAILSVLLGHTGYYVLGGAGGVALFLILSGYGLNLSCEAKGFALFWDKRLRKVFLPYFFVGLFALAGRRIWDPRAIVCTLLGLDLGLIADPTMWYISYILLWYLVYYVLARLSLLIGKPWLRRLLLLLALVGASFGFRLLYARGFWHPESGASLYSYAFPLGVALSCLTEFKVKESTRSLFQLSFLFVTAAYMLGSYSFVNSELMAMMMGLFPLSIVLAVRIRGRLEALLLWFGRYSYPIYLFEGLLLFQRGRLFAKMTYKPLIDLTYFAVTIAMALIYWEGAYKKFETLLPKKLLPF